MHSGSMLFARGLTGHCSVIASASRAFILTGHLFISSPRPSVQSHTESITSLLTVRHNMRDQTRPVFTHQCLWGGPDTCQHRTLWCNIALLTRSLMAACHVSSLRHGLWSWSLSYPPITPMILTLFSITFNLGSAVKQRASPNQMYLIGAVLNRFALW